MLRSCTNFDLWFSENVIQKIQKEDLLKKFGSFNPFSQKICYMSDHHKKTSHKISCPLPKFDWKSKIFELNFRIWTIFLERDLKAVVLHQSQDSLRSDLMMASADLPWLTVVSWETSSVALPSPCKCNSKLFGGMIWRVLRSALMLFKLTGMYVDNNITAE